MGFVSILLKAKFKNALQLYKTVLSNRTIELEPCNSQLDCLVIGSKESFFRPDLNEKLEHLFSRLFKGMGCSR